VNTVDEIQQKIDRAYPARLVCELPDHEFDFGGLVWRITTAAGHHSGRATVGGLGLWNVPASSLSKLLR
jgi:hypothetical protein